MLRFCVRQARQDVGDFSRKRLIKIEAFDLNWHGGTKYIPLFLWEIEDINNCKNKWIYTHTHTCILTCCWCFGVGVLGWTIVISILKRPRCVFYNSTILCECLWQIPWSISDHSIFACQKCMFRGPIFTLPISSQWYVSSPLLHCPETNIFHPILLF